MAKAKNRLKISDECNSVEIAKKFEMCTMVRCPDCNAIMVTLEESVYCSNPACDSFEVKYQVPTIELERK